MNKIYPISAVVVTYNEEKYLDKALSQLDFCEEVVVIDLGSHDKSVEIAKQYGAKIVEHQQVPIVEIIHSKLELFVKNKWVLIQDPDEVISDELKTEIKELFSNKLKSSLDIGAVYAPWQFYFKGKRLKGTIWGGRNKRILLVHLDRFSFSSDVHRGRKLNPGYQAYSIPWDENKIIRHYWSDSWRQLFSKHKRYIKREGKARFNNGEKTGLKIILKTPFKAFKHSFWNKKAYSDGITGFLLSLFWAWYSLSSEISLYKYQKTQYSETKHNHSK
jgi:glycosyltransferase involved in cell wall biosynthesis